MSDYQQRLSQLIADHEQMFVDYESLRPLLEDNRDFDTADPRVQQWYQEFLPIKDRMYELAYDLGIPFESGEVSGDDYARVWQQVQNELSRDGNRRTARHKL